MEAGVSEDDGVAAGLGVEPGQVITDRIEGSMTHPMRVLPTLK